jgi:hypothetical protein
MNVPQRHEKESAATILYFSAVSFATCEVISAALFSPSSDCVTLAKCDGGRSDMISANYGN